MSQRIDQEWLRAHPLPVHGEGTDKNTRGRVLAVGGSEFVPGALRLTGEAALRAGAGKLQMATVQSAAMALGVLVPEAAMIALSENDEGEISAEAAGKLVDSLERCDTLIFGPGMRGGDNVSAILRRLLENPKAERSVLLDAAAIEGAADLPDMTAAHDGRIVITPHFGEMAAMRGMAMEEIEGDPEAVARDVARRYGVLVVLKSAATIISSPDGETMLYSSDCTGLATGGSGDVLAGVIGGLMARGASPLVAAAWGVWLHGEAGRCVAESIGPTGFLARDLLPEIPRLMAQ
ncbi:NAD(P)H-hydrate dehydratase [Sphingobium sp. SCG-1]|uniref:NAD(P)H-hydrate dehydratase n=1 Tax=Sphingobium sp. SCG-1 TaxID=2072936 RepID=UPI000CD6A5BD|nr:NAD(P)H-hydrate dehydratase [Sphingobium sp. SCG-1]AUW57361.1 NAD(P)H-hydrate dehydratase [Sphingobium sp. SCG-1]